MNREETTNEKNQNRMPHARGDEPRVMGEVDKLPIRMPHARGDEPIVICHWHKIARVCPTHVGMNRFDFAVMEYAA